MGKRAEKNLLKTAIKTASRQATPSGSQYNSDDDNYSIASDISEATYLSLDSEEELILDQSKSDITPEDGLKYIMELLTESRTQTREDALEKLIKLFRFNYILEEVEPRQETLFKYLKKALAKGQSNKEKVLAAKAMSLLAVTLDPEDEEMFESLENGMVKVARDSDKADVRVAFLQSLAMVCFVSGVDKHDLISLSHQYIELLEEEDTPAPVLEAILSSLGLLVAGLKMRGQSEEVRRLFIKSIDCHFDLLDYPDASVRIAAGENVALFFEVMASAKLDHGYKYLNDLVSKINMLLHDRSRFRSKKERLHQRTAFRSIVATVEDGENPEIKLKFKTRNVFIHSWVSMKMLQHFRSVLAGGLHIHMEKNELLADVFGDSMIFSGLAGTDSPRIVNSANSAISKARSQQKAAHRTNLREYLDENMGEVVDSFNELKV
ncbi:Interferon- developmental regulator 1 [Entomophthora muscae]|uniref:Interferon- developmental regulator 1 n=1 Tax=Entomophthora muscae TaxID=34485 RepID=A0ACC2SI98_9FUNG|nr:Interferon- developmental regulator 1 [Entomophthora muscae]